ncbi:MULTISPECIES: DUF6082 family protein [unclassified Streptomyces]|uniref:DUF6082 family protein n=1 Tax=Streptomyces sp. NPDC055082 TaxID=3365718 RepID=UPI0037D951DF
MSLPADHPLSERCPAFAPSFVGASKPPVQSRERTARDNANRWVSLWSVMLRSRFLTPSSMREVAEEFMESPVGRAFWELARNHRRITARDHHDERVNGLMNGAYAGVCHVSAAV